MEILPVSSSNSTAVAYFLYGYHGEVKYGFQQLGMDFFLVDCLEGCRMGGEGCIVGVDGVRMGGGGISRSAIDSSDDKNRFGDHKVSNLFFIVGKAK
ncbi:hypothetical protein Tco_1230364 [Tanacetum coccineum]